MTFHQLAEFWVIAELGVGRGDTEGEGLFRYGL
jgi:hypothetical protein